MHLPTNSPLRREQEARGRREAEIRQRAADEDAAGPPLDKKLRGGSRENYTACGKAVTVSYNCIPPCCVFLLAWGG